MFFLLVLPLAWNSPELLLPLLVWVRSSSLLSFGSELFSKARCVFGGAVDCGFAHKQLRINLAELCSSIYFAFSLEGGFVFFCLFPVTVYHGHPRFLPPQISCPALVPGRKASRPLGLSPLDQQFSFYNRRTLHAVR